MRAALADTLPDACAYFGEQAARKAIAAIPVLLINRLGLERFNP